MEAAFRKIALRSKIRRFSPTRRSILSNSFFLAKKGPLIRGDATYNGIMPSWRYDLNDEQVAAVLNELLERWAPGRPAITASQVAAVRQQTIHLKTFSEAEQ